MTPRLEDLLLAAIAKEARALRVSGPGIVTAYDATTQKASVQPAIKEGSYDRQGNREVSRPSLLVNVPVMFLSTSDGYRHTVPIAVGDTVLIAYCDRSLDRWSVRGGEVDPEDDRAHSPSDAVAIPTLHDFAHPIANVGTKPAIGYPDALVEFTSAQIQAGGTAALALHSVLTILWNHVAALPTWPGGVSSPAVPIAGSLGSGTAKLRGG